MGLFEKIFGSKAANQKTTTRFELINDSGGGFYNWNGNLFKSDIIRSAIRPEITAIGKLTAEHVINNSRGLKVNPNENIKHLLKRPNPLMNAQVFQEKMAIQLRLNNNAFAYIVRDDLAQPTAIYPLPASSIEVKEGVLGDIFLKFNFNNGKIMTIPYDDIIHLRRDFNNDDFFGDPPGEALTSLMDIIYTSDQGIVKAIKNSSIVKWIMKFTQVLRSEDMKKAVDDFTENYLSIDKAGGAAAADGKYDLQQVNNQAYVPDDKQASNTIQRVYSFFNTNDDIVQSKYTEDQWNAFYEANVEPFALQMANELTYKLFTEWERRKGNEVIYKTASLQYASMSTKMNLVQMVDRGALTPNEWREVMNLPPLDGGNEPIRRLDTAAVSTPNSKGGDEKDGSGKTELHDDTDNSRDSE